MLIGVVSTGVAQQYLLYNTETLYDAFENPSQRAFQNDESFQFASNFLFPTISANGSVNRSDKSVAINSDVNAYLFMLRAYMDVEYDREIGVSWQVRNDSYLESPWLNGQVASPKQAYADVGDNSYAQSYHQLSVAYRTNILYKRSGLYDGFLDGKLGVGVKLSYLSGIGNKTIWPDLKYPGASISLSANANGRNGWHFLGSLKDLGVLKGSNIEGEEEKMQLIKAKLEALASKEIGNYRGSILFSKNVFHRGWNAALMHNYRVIGNLNLSAFTAYSPHTDFQLGVQMLIKSSNCEFYLGSNQVIDTYDKISPIFEGNKPGKSNGSNREGMSFYIGFSAKFGNTMYHRANSPWVPRVNSPWFLRLFKH